MASRPAPLRVLVADDDRETANVLAAILRDEGHEVHVALRGDEVSDIDRLMRPDVVILGSARGAGRWHRCSSPFQAPGRTSPTDARAAKRAATSKKSSAPCDSPGRRAWQAPSQLLSFSRLREARDSNTRSAQRQRAAAPSGS